MTNKKAFNLPLTDPSGSKLEYHDTTVGNPTDSYYATMQLQRVLE
jgi:hypothetical protein